MARFVVRSIGDIKKLAETDIKVGDVVDHKAIDYPIFTGELKKVFPESETFPATVGTDIYATYGAGVSMITKLTVEL